MASVAERWHGHCLVKQLQILTAAKNLIAGLNDRKVRIVRHHGLRERGELYPLLAKLMNLPHDLFNRSLAAIEDGTQLNCAGFNNFI